MTPAEILARPFGALPDLIRAHAAMRPTGRALIQDDEIITYAELNRLMDRIAATLQRDGARPGDVAAIISGTRLEYAAVFLGALRAGLAVAPMSPSATPDQLAAMLRDCGARLLFLDAANEAALGGSITVPSLRLDAPAFAAWLAPDGAIPTPVATDPEAAFNIIYSSGTTGIPKGIVQPNKMRWAHVQRGAIYGYDGDAMTLLSTPLYSNTTLISFLPTLAMGGTVILMAKFSEAAYLALAERHRVTHTMLVPVQYSRLMAHPDFARYDLSAFKHKFSTSAPFAAALKAEVLKRWPGGLTEIYGMTEGGGTCILQAHLFPHKLHSVGRPAEGHDIRMIDEQGQELPRGETGEIVGRSPTLMMTGYHNQPEKTAEAEWFDAGGRRYIRTGDVGRFDADGFVLLMDRKKDMIISGGFNIYPSDIEAILQQHPAVRDVAVVGLASARWGETPAAFVVLDRSAEIPAEILLAWANERLGRMQRLAAVEYLPELPRNAIGKVLKRELRAAFKNAMA